MVQIAKYDEYVHSNLLMVYAIENKSSTVI